MPLKQEHRMLAMDTALGVDVLGLRSVSIQEQLSRLFHIEADLSSESGEIDFDRIVGHNATIRIDIGQQDTRFFNGFVSRFVQGANRGGFAQYHATIVPWLWFLTRTSDCRMFQDKTTPEIIEEVFKGHGFTDFSLKLSATYAKKEYCVQYRETDFNFVSRLMEQEGIYYFFVHQNGKHTLVLADSISAHTSFAGYEEVTFQELEKGAAGREVITDWVVEKEVQPVAYALNDFDFKKPKASLASSTSVTRQHGGAVFEIYDYPGAYVEHGDGDRLAQVRLDELQTQRELLRGTASARGLATGCTFQLKNHPRADQNREYLVTGVNIQADAGEFASTGAGGSSEFFTCNFTAMEKAQQFRSARLTAKPIVQGPQTAMVVGPKGEEIHTDKYGRLKVQFPWDRHSKADETSSCWIRVAQAWAGKKWGAIYTPRVGQEVIVEFLEGDPDRPIITGRVYNEVSMPPYDLPANKTISTVKSNSSKGGGGFNEIRFEDKKGSEQIFLHAEMDQDIRVKNDAREWIGHERHLIVKKDQLELVEEDKHATVKGDSISKIEGDESHTVDGDQMAAVGGNQHLEVKGDQAEKVGGSASLKVGGSLNIESGAKISRKAGSDIHEKAGMNVATDAGMAIHLKAGMTIVIEAGVQISLKAGPSFVDIGPAGVAISGPMVMINSGGAAGSGSGSSPTAPTPPDPPAAPKEVKVAATADPGEKNEPPPTPTPPTPTQFSSAAQVLKTAAANGTPFCEVCARQ
ncbi:MAG: type VI secretion system tip protein TssI/VgrG [Verrucomicrobiota bacterium]